MTANTPRSGARFAIFASIRENLAASGPLDGDLHDHAGLKSSVASVLAPGGPVDVIEGFRSSLEMVGAKCAVAENENDAAELLSKIISDRSARKVVISDSELVRRFVDAAGIEAIQDASREQLFSSDIGITGAQLAIAETGTLVLESGVERHRLVSLVPPVHVCVLMAGSIRQSMAEILEMVDTDANPTITFVTGASRTSDIELTLAIGVHGPGELHVIVIKDQ